MNSAKKRATPWLCFTAEAANSTIRLDIKGAPDPVALETSTDGKTWSPYAWSGNTGATITLASVGDKVYWRATTKNVNFSEDPNLNYYVFAWSYGSRYAVSGNLLSLLDRNCETTIIPTAAFSRLFQSSDSLSPYTEFAEDLIPATEVGVSALQYTFIRCGNARRFPDIKRFQSLASSCLVGAFTSSSIREIDLGDTPPGYNCYGTLLQGCGSISHIKVGFKSWETSVGSAFTTNWCQDYGGGTFPQTGTFECPDELPEIFDSSHIPVGWTVDKPIKHYVQDGLVFQLDSKVGKASSTWTDIQNGVELNIIGDVATCAALDFDEGYTIEMVTSPLKFYHSGYLDVGTIFGTGNACLRLRHENTQVAPGLYTDSITLHTNGGDKTLTNMQYNLLKTHGLWIVSAQTTAQTIYVGDGNQLTLDSGGGYISGNTSIQGVQYIKSIRVYNRTLTDREREINRALDIQRFG